MDESGGNGQPRSGNDESAERHAGPAAPAGGSARPAPTPRDETAHPKPTAPDAPDDKAAGTTPPGVTDGPSPAPDPTFGEPPEGPTSTESTPEASVGVGSAPAAPAGADTTSEAPAGADTTPEAPAGADTTPEGPAEAGTTSEAAADAEVPLATAEHTHPEDQPTAPADRAHPNEPGAPGVPDSHAPDPDRPTPHTPAPGDRTLAHSAPRKNRPPQRAPEPRGGLLMGRPFGVPVYVAPSWFLVAALITWVFGNQLDRVLPELGAARYLVSLFFAVAFYASVLVHELAHTVAALRFKLPVRRIQLQFFGGVSEIEKEAETPGREFVLAFVGPLLSLILSGLFYLALRPVEPGTVPGVLLAGLMVSNLIVAVFNLLPGLPLDGGRMLRAVVWKITGRAMSGTIAAAWVGRALAVSVLIGLPLLTQSGALGSTAEDSVGMDTVFDALLAAILAAIIWTGAGNSLRMARLREHLPELRARNLTRRAVPVETDTPLSEALRRANAAGARALVVVDANGEPLSLVREAAIVGVPEHRRPWVAVSGLAQDLTDGMRVSAELAGEDLLDVLRATPATEYLVVEDTGEIYGVLSAADVERAFVKAMARPS
ncbi:site-2 protease family protein [Streptomyces sp. NPDC002928]|uniref:site-2 protease family protein n=1 Tax=Streptomyces sp. NPDC002928 TaxID=3154440 RepID=UPI0033A65EFC